MLGYVRMGPASMMGLPTAARYEGASGILAGPRVSLFDIDIDNGSIVPYASASSLSVRTSGIRAAHSV